MDKAKKMGKRTLIGALVVFFAVCSYVYAEMIHIPGDYGSIQDAIDDSNDGDILIVSPGTYSKINFNGKNVTVISNNPDDPSIVAATVIDAGGTGSAVTFTNGEGPDAVLSGFTITGGYGTVNADFGEEILWGAGIYCYQASPTITRNVVTNNDGPAGTGGVEGYGGGISCLESGATVMGNIIRDNSAYAGAGIIAYLGTDRISSNLIYDNTASYGGGACMLNGNMFNNNTLVGNIGSVYGGNIFASYVIDTGQSSLVNNIVSGALLGGGIYYEHDLPEPCLPAYNNVWGNSGGNYTGISDQTGINGNVSEDPLFVNEGSDDFHLQSSSPCINAGDPDFVAGAGETDIDGEDRIYAVRVDIGADEYVGYIHPVADAGENQYLDVIGLVTLDGSGSFFYDPCGVRQFLWAQSGGPSVILSDPCAEQPSFMPVSETEYSFELVVSDGINVSLPDTVVIVVGNRPPVAVAGPNSVCQVGERVYLDGSGSYDPDPVDELTYSWRQVEGPNVVLEGANTPNAFFEPNESELYVFELVVNDGICDSDPSIVHVVAVMLTSNQQGLNVSYFTDDYFHYPDVSGNRVVYSVGRACDFVWSIACKSLTTGSLIELDAWGIDTQPKIDGDVVVWFGGPYFGAPWYHEPSNSGIFVRNLSTRAQIVLRQYTMSESYSHAAISGNTVVWLEHLGLDTLPLGSSEANNWWNTPYNVCGADISNLYNPRYFTIDVNVGRRDPYPCHSYSYDFDDVIDISGNIVVWEGDGDIYGADISDLNNIDVFSICTNAARQYDPAISGNVVVWTDERNDGGDIYGADISDIENIRVFEVVNKIGNQKEAAIDGCVIVYVDVTDGLYGGTIKACCLIRHYGTLEIELIGSPYGMGPAIDDEKIVWQDDYYGKAQGIDLNVSYSIFDGSIENVTTSRKYDYIQHAINHASEGDELLVYPGTYHEEIDFDDKNVTLRSVSPEDPCVVAATVIEGHGGSVVTFSGGESSSCELSGFVISGGSMGIDCCDAEPNIMNCVIEENSNVGIFCRDSELFVSGCVVRSNGGAGFDIAGEPLELYKIENCVITDNGGGGLVLDYIRGNLSNCEISGNGGSGLRIDRWINVMASCLIAGNDGAGIEGYSGAGLTAKNCSITENRGIGIGLDGFRTVTISNSIIYGNGQAGMTGAASVIYSDVEGGFSGLGNIDVDPCFALPGYWDANGTAEDTNDDYWIKGDYHLLSDSAVIDMGDPEYVTAPNETDLDGNIRIADGDNDGNSVVDMGAYEFFLPPIEVEMKLTPQTVNANSEGKWIKAHFKLPEGVLPKEVDVNRPAVLEPLGIESEYIEVFVNDEGIVEVVASFNRSEFCSCEPFGEGIIVEGLSFSDQCFYGVDSVRVIDRRLELIGALAMHWLEVCAGPDWCEGSDVDEDGVVNFRDLALIEGFCVEVISE